MSLVFPIIWILSGCIEMVLSLQEKIMKEMQGLNDLHHQNKMTLSEKWLLLLSAALSQSTVESHIYYYGQGRP